MAEPTISEDLNAFFVEKLGSNWRSLCDLTVRCDTLGWFVRLIERGILAMEEDWRGQNPDGNLQAAQIASLGSWKIDLEYLVEQIKANAIKHDLKRKSKS